MTKELASCRIWPNCVPSRLDAAAYHRIEPFAVSGDPAAAFAEVKALVEELPRTEILTATENYFHAVCRTRWGFADDLKFLVNAEEGVIHVRSASRTFWAFYDSGVNRRRVEALRQRLASA